VSAVSAHRRSVRLLLDSRADPEHPGHRGHGMGIAMQSRG
jgi:hypothetical protein